jgi:hypothetical protein
MTNTWKGVKRVIAAAAVAAVLGSAEYAVAGFMRVDRVQSRSTKTWTTWVSSGHSRVIVDGDGTTDLDCYVYNVNGVLLGKDDDPTDYCVVDLRLSPGGTLLIQVTNRGNVYNDYTLWVE